MKESNKKCILGLAVALALALPTWSARANVYATNIKINGSTNSPTVFTGNNVAISYILNEPASSGVTITIASRSAVVRSIAVPAGDPGTLRGANTVNWDGRDDAGNPVPGADYACSITAKAAGYAVWTKTTSDANPGNQVWQPWGLAVNQNTKSFYYGRVFVANSYLGPTTNTTDLLGFQKLNADGSPAEEGIYSSGGYPWNGSYSESPFRIKVGADDRFYAEDWSGNGVIMSWDQQITTNSMLNVMTDYNNPGGNLGGFTVTGAGANRQLWMADNTTSGYGIILWNMQADGTLAYGDMGTQIMQVGSPAGLDDSAFDVTLDKNGKIYVTVEPGSATYMIMRFPAYSGAPLATADWKTDNTSYGDGNGDNDFAIAVDPTAAYAAVARNESNALLILDANIGLTITNISVGNPAHAVAWDNVGNAYIAFDVTGAESLWQAWSPPGANQATTAALETIHVLPPPLITTISRIGNNVTIYFTGPATDPPSAYVLLSGAAVSGVTNPASANITGGGGSYQATLTSSASVQFYRIERP
jgi:hypothetical protein